MKLLLVIAILMLVTGPALSQPTERHVVKHGEKLKTVKGLEDCTYYEFVPEGWRRPNYLHVIRCPNSSTTTRYKEGKSNEQSVTLTDEQQQLLDAAAARAKQELLNTLKDALK